MKHKIKTKKDPEMLTAEYYSLKTKAVDELVEANAGNAPEYSDEELRKYRSGLSKYKVSDWLKIILVKVWFPGAVCYYMLWGLSNYTSSSLDLLVATGLVLGMVTDLFTNNLLRWFSKEEGGNDRWMMFPEKSFLSFFLNILYACVLLYLVFIFYNVINLILVSITGDSDQIGLGVGPILFGIFYFGFDMLLISCKHLLIRIFKDAKYGKS